MKIYTRSGDDGTTSLAGGQRIDKSSLRLEAYGMVDELISWLGLLAAMQENNTRVNELQTIQDKLMHIAAILASGEGAKMDRIVFPHNKDIEALELSIDLMETGLKPLGSFILPGGSEAVSKVHIARTVCRRTERAILRIDDKISVNKVLIKYVNRLSDYLFVLSRSIESDTGKPQSNWNS